MPDYSLGDQYAARLPLLQELCRSLKEETREALQGHSHIDRVAFRVKDVASFVTKATDPYNEPPYTSPLVEIEDQVAGRIIVFFLSDLDSVRERLDGAFNTIERSERRPLRDAEFGYESHHLICLIPPHRKPEGWDNRTDVPATFELQIRTILMHAYAEPQHDIAYKGPRDLPRDARRELGWIAASAWGADQAFERVRKWSDARPGPDK